MNGHVHDELPALLAGELPPAAAAVHAHLAGCDRCRLDLAAVAFAAGELRSTARLPFADPAELPPLRLAPPEEAAERRRGAAGPPLERPAGAGQLVGPAAVVVAVTDDGLDPAYQATRQGAYAVAAREGARVVLFDRSPELYLVDPYERARGTAAARELAAQPAHGQPARPALPGRAARRGRPARPGRRRLGGPRARPRRPGRRLRGPGRRTGGAPGQPGHPALIDRVRGHTLAAFRRRVPARITLADLDGTLAEVD